MDQFEKVMAVVIVATCVGFLWALLALIGGAS